jgi:hypothetical protein
VGGVSTGVEIRLIDEVEAWVEHVYVDDALERRRRLEGALERDELVLVETQVFVEVDGRKALRGTTSAGHEVVLGEDVTNQLMAIAHEAREVHLGDLLGDLGRQGRELARWDFYAAPFRVELSDALRERVRPA